MHLMAPLANLQALRSVTPAASRALCLKATANEALLGIEIAAVSLLSLTRVSRSWNSIPPWTPDTWQRVRRIKEERLCAILA